MRLLNIPKKPLLESSLALACELLLGGEMVCYNITAYNEIINFTVSKREVYNSKLRTGIKAERGMVMKGKNLERAVILGLLLSTGVYGTAWAEEFDHNISLTKNNDSRTYDNLVVNVDATGDVYNNNFENIGYENTFYINTGVLVWNNNVLMVNEKLDINIIPAPWAGNKSDLGNRRGIFLQNTGSIIVNGETNILVDNYTHTDDYDSLIENNDLDLDYGMDAQMGIEITDENSSANFNGNLNITMLDGNRSMGILANDNANLTVDGNTTITVKNAPYYTYGISNQYSDQKYDFSYNDDTAKLNFKGNLTIKTEGGNNSVGINLKDSSYKTDDVITVSGHLDITASGAKGYENKTDLQEFPNSVSNYGTYMYNIGSSTFNTASIKTYSTGSDVESIGSYNYLFSNTTFKGDVVYDTQADKGATEISALARAGSTLNYEKGLKANGNVVLNAVGNTSGDGSEIVVNSTKDINADVQLNGNIVVGKTEAAMILGEKYDTAIDADTTQNKVAVNLLNSKSYFTGINEFGNENGFKNSSSEINLNFANGAKWNMTGSTEVTDLTLSKNALLDMTYNNETAASFRTLNAKNLSGNNGIINMNIDASTNVNNSDRIYVDGTHSGTQYITLNNIGDSTDGAHGTVLVSVKDEQGEFKANDSEGALFWNTYEIGRKDVTNGEEVTDGYNTDWYLKDIKQDENKSTTSVDAILGANSLNYHTWRAENDQLMRRMGELRNNGGDEQGAWFRVHGSKINRDDNAAFENQYTSYELGYDQVTKKTEDVTRYTGAALSYTDGNSSYDTGSGENHSKSLSFYNTDIYSSGHYLDLVFKFANMDNDFNVYDTNGNEISGEYKNNGISLSAEYGRKNNLNSGWYIEPQAQLTVGYFGGDEYETSNGIQVDQSGIASVLGRIGFNIGKELGDSGIIYAKANLLHEFAGDYDIDMTDSLGNHRTESESFNDTWFEYGIGAALKTGKNNHLYFDFVKTAGGDFEKDWQWNAGMRWTF